MGTRLGPKNCSPGALSRGPSTHARARSDRLPSSDLAARSSLVASASHETGPSLTEAPGSHRPFHGHAPRVRASTPARARLGVVGTRAPRACTGAAGSDPRAHPRTSRRPAPRSASTGSPTAERARGRSVRARRLSEPKRTLAAARVTGRTSGSAPPRAPSTPTCTVRSS